jgi:hypothetical protein
MRVVAIWTLIPLVLFVSRAQAQDTIYRNGFEAACNTEDADQDRLSGCEEVLVATNPLLADTDGDGLLDGDEVLGTPFGLDLPAMGVDPRRKDLLVEMDWTNDISGCAPHSHRVTPQIVTRLKQIFASAPVNNADGSTGINLIVDFGQGGLFTGGNFVALENGYTLGFGPDYYTNRAANFSPNRYGYFRYQLHGHKPDALNDNLGAAVSPGDDSIVTMGCLFDARDTVVVILHELGHNMGLLHGGHQFCDDKPNYNSIMNHKYFGGLDVDCDSHPDSLVGDIGFSDGSRGPLDPRAVDESRGVCRSNHPAFKPIDWNCNGAIDPGTVVDPLLQCWDSDVLADHDDYAALQIPPVTPQGLFLAPAVIDASAGSTTQQAPHTEVCFGALASKRAAAAPICGHPTPFP